MIFLYLSSAGNERITLENNDFRYIITVRRHKKDDTIAVQNGNDAIRYWYTIASIEKKKAILVKTKEEPLVHQEYVGHLAWGICDLHTIFATLPMLQQIGVKKLSLLKTQRSQGNIKIPHEKIQSILINSAQQCGRNNLLEWEVIDFSDFLSQYPSAVLLDIGTEKIDRVSSGVFVIGPEGGWSDEEKLQMKEFHKRSLPGDLVLKSETALVMTATIQQMSTVSSRL